jgi:alanyl-tRNA synthetase
MNTDLLYYQDPYLRTFRARVVARKSFGGRPAVALDRTAFYPTGGGQPHDTGTLAPAASADGGEAVAVVEVLAEDGLVWHILEQDLSAEEVNGAIDWPRRFDHMQQHTGQHILSQAFIQACAAETVAFHLGSTASTIDLNRVPLGPNAVAAAEALANAIVDDARPVSTAFYTEAELDQLPLRRPPKVSGRIRVVQVQDYDWSACGGTHLNNTAQVGLIKVVGTERRGPETRVTFLCGRRARADYARLLALAEELAGRFTTGQDELPAAVERLQAENRALRRELGELEAQWVASTASAMWAGARVAAPGRVVAGTLDCSVERAKRVAQSLRARPGAVVLLGVRSEQPYLIFTRADDVDVHVGELLKVAVAAGGGRGGGRADWAQGGVPAAEKLDAALTAALSALGVNP